MTVSKISVAVIGGGPAGIAAATAAAYDGASVLLIEREKRLGGKLKQSIHKGFGFTRFDDTLSGPEYAYYDISMLNQTNAIVLLQTTVTEIVRIGSVFQLTMINRHGVSVIEANAIVLATGCRERTFCEIGLFGSRPAGVFSAGTAQYFLNALGQLPANRCLILGTDNLSLVTARDLTLAGAKVLGVYEPSDAPVGYPDYVSHCIFDFGIPLYFRHTILRAFGTGRLRGVELARVDESGNPIRGSQSAAACDGLIVSGGFIPDTSLAVSLSVPVSERSGGPICDHNRMTLIDGVFACGNALAVSDIVDYVSENGEIAGRGAARHFPRTRQLVEISASNDFLTVIPQYIDLDVLYGETVLFFNCAKTCFDVNVRVFADSSEIYCQKFDILRPSETQRITVDFPDSIEAESRITMRLE